MLHFKRFTVTYYIINTRITIVTVDIMVCIVVTYFAKYLLI